MGLIDDIRKDRDSWMVRFEEHRQDEDEEDELTGVSEEKKEKEILRNREMVGVFPKKEIIK